MQGACRGQRPVLWTAPYWAVSTVHGTAQHRAQARLCLQGRCAWSAGKLTQHSWIVRQHNFEADLGTLEEVLLEGVGWLRTLAPASPVEVSWPCWGPHTAGTG